MTFGLESLPMGTEDSGDHVDYEHLDELIEAKFDPDEDELVEVEAEVVGVEDGEDGEDKEAEYFFADDEDEEVAESKPTWPSRDDEAPPSYDETDLFASDVHAALSASGHPAYDYGTVTRDHTFVEFDHRTVQAITRFQRANGLDATGEVDAATAKALDL